MSKEHLMDFQIEQNEMRHSEAEVIQRDLLADNIHVPVHDICNCSKCRDLRREEVESR